jgi:uncharacterized protein (DUF362 family)
MGASGHSVFSADAAVVAVPFSGQGKVHMHTCSSRRRFLQATLLGGISSVAAWHAAKAAAAGAGGGPARVRRPVPGGPEPSTVIVPPAPRAKVAVTSAKSRAEQVTAALKSLEKEITAAIGNKPIVIKPNNVVVTDQLCATHAETIAAILEFLKSIKKIDGVVIAESPAAGTAMEGFSNYGYEPVAKKYGVKLIDLDQQPTEILQTLDETEMRPKPVRVAKMMLQENSFIISAPPMKTHNLAVATLSLKNVVLGSPIKDDTGADKPYVHGNGFWAINYNLFSLAPRLHPDLAVLDGFEGMEGAGPVSGTAVDHKVCVAGLDWVAVDTTGVRLMGIDPKKVGYLSFATAAAIGQGDPAKIDIIGEAVEKHVKKYELAPNVDDQFSWVDGPQYG